MGRLLFLAATIVGVAIGLWLFRQVVLTRRVGRRFGGPEGFIAETQWHAELVRLLQQCLYLAVSVNSFIANGMARLTGSQARGVVLILLAEVLVTINSLLALRARHRFRDRFGASTLSLQGQLVAMTFERDRLLERNAELEAELRRRDGE